MKRISILLLAATSFAVPACSSDVTPNGGDDDGSGSGSGSGSNQGSGSGSADQWDTILANRVVDYNAALKIAAPVIGYFSAMFLHALWNGLAYFKGGGFFIGYFLLEVPMFCAFLAVVFHVVRREGRILKQSLAVEVERGLITQCQLDIAISVFRRTRWVAVAIRQPRLFNARRRFLRSVAKLGLCHWHKQRATEAEQDTDSFPLINQFQAEVFSLRDHVG